MASYVKIATLLGMNSNSTEQSSPNTYEGNIPFNRSCPSFRCAPLPAPLPAPESPFLSLGSSSSGTSTPSSRTPKILLASLIKKVAISLAIKQDNGTFIMPTHWDIRQPPPFLDRDLELDATAVKAAAMTTDHKTALAACHKHKLFNVLAGFHQYRQLCEFLLNSLLYAEEQLEVQKGEVSNLQAKVSMIEDDAEADAEDKTTVINTHKNRIAELKDRVQVMAEAQKALEEEKIALEVALERERVEHTEKLAAGMAKRSQELVFLVTGRVARANSA